jgi:hypothetical protein
MSVTVSQLKVKIVINISFGYNHLVILTEAVDCFSMVPSCPAFYTSVDI